MKLELTDEEKQSKMIAMIIVNKDLITTMHGESDMTFSQAVDMFKTAWLAMQSKATKGIETN